MTRFVTMDDFREQAGECLIMVKRDPDGRKQLTVTKADPFVLATSDVVSQWLREDLSDLGVESGDMTEDRAYFVVNFGREGHGVGRVTYRVGTQPLREFSGIMAGLLPGLHGMWRIA